VRLIGDPPLRRRIADNARREILWKVGPEGRAEEMAILIDLLKGDRAAARALEIHVSRQKNPPSTALLIPAYNTVFEVDQLGACDVTVTVSIYNCQASIVDALNSVVSQTLSRLDLVVIDDHSIDDSLAVVLNWVKINAGRFNRVSVLQNRANSGLGATRNLAFENAETQFVLPLDVNNRLLPGCAAACLQTLQASSAAFAYSVTGCDRERLGTVTADPVWLPNRTRIALIAKAAWALVGGYDNVRPGRQDFDIWCKFAERGLLGLRVPGGPLLEYRCHGVSTKTTSAIEGQRR
jgi:hypothetical protein